MITLCSCYQIQWTEVFELPHCSYITAALTCTKAAKKKRQLKLSVKKNNKKTKNREIINIHVQPSSWEIPTDASLDVSVLI